MKYTRRKKYLLKYYEVNKERIKRYTRARAKRLQGLPIHKNLRSLLAFAKPDVTTGKTALREYSSKLKYLSVHCYGRNYLVHRLVMMQATQAWIPKGLEVNHINGNKQDNRRENLELVTRSQNVQHAWDSGLRHKYTPEEKAQALKRYRAKQKGYQKAWKKRNPEKIRQYNRTSYMNQKLKRLVEEIRKIGEPK